MSNIEYIKARIKHLYETNPKVHISVHTTRPKLTVENTSAVIVGVYPNIFRVAESDSGVARIHSVQYVSVLTGEVRIFELDYAPIQQTKKQ